MVNVIIPCYNNKDTLPETLDSLVAQTKKMFIVTIVEDHGDQTEEIDKIVEKYRSRLQIRYIKNKVNLGPGLTRQVGIDADTQCDYFMFVDSDDMLYPRAIETLYREAKGTGADVIGSGFFVEQRGSIGFEKRPPDNITWTHGKIYRAEFLKKNKIRFSSLIRYNEDAAFNVVCMNLAKKKYMIEEITYLWRDYKNSITRDSKNSFDDENIPDFLLGQCEAIDFVYHKTGFKNDILATLAVIYNFYIIHLYYHKNPRIPEVEKYLFNIFNLDDIKEELNKESIKRDLLSLIKNSFCENKKIWFYPVSFAGWVGEYNKDIYS